MSIDTYTGTTAAELPDYDRMYTEAFQQLHATLERCANDDWEDAKRGKEQIESRMSLRERTCPGADKERQRFEDDGRAIVQAMWDAYTRLSEQYTNDAGLSKHVRVPATLKSVVEQTWQPVAKALEPISRDIAQRMEQNHWKGNGADDYMKQLPMQQAAVAEFGQYVEVATIGVDVPGQMQATVLSTGVQHIMAIPGQLETTTGGGFQIDGTVFFARCARAKAVIDHVHGLIARDLLDGQQTWRVGLSNHVREMTSNRVANPEVLKGDAWPRATKDTKDIPAPPTGPIVDRQDTAVHSSDPVPPAVPSGQGGVDSDDYQTDDNGGRLW